MSPSKLKVILIANYRPDRQESMQRFARMLSEGLTARNIDHTVDYPAPILHRFHCGNAFLCKWFGYIDKFLIYPLILHRRLKKACPSACVVHICDHSNTPYTSVVRQFPHLATCHDLTAIKSGLGITPHHKTRLSGKLLQRYIMRGLRTTKCIVCISAKTQSDLQKLVPAAGKRSVTVFNALNYPYTPMPENASQAIVMPWVKSPFILHVGGNAWYKNRIGVLHIFAKMRRDFPAHKLVFVGPPPDQQQQSFLHTQGLAEQVVFVQDIDNETLRAFYSIAQLLLFPSHEEGFGWPIIEAQACGCPVAVVERDPMRTIAGQARIRLPETPPHAASLEDWALTSAKAISQLLTQEKRDTLVAQGLLNAQRFSHKEMIDAYVRIYEQLVNSVRHS